MPTPRLRLVRTAATLAAATLLAPAVLALPAQASPAGDSLVINEAYTNGGSAGALFTHKFVELYNPTDQPISLDGWSLQYRSATGTTAPSTTVALSGTVPAKGHFLIQGGSNGATGAALPTPDLTTSFNPAGTKGTIVLADQAGTVAGLPTGSVVTDQVAGVADVLGYGATNTFETAASGAPAANSDPKSIARTGGADTDDNAADFTVTADVTPQNAAGGGTAPVDPVDPVDPTPAPAPSVTVAEIQGTGATSPLEGRRVSTTGVVTAVYSTGGYDGFYIQTAGTGGAEDATPGASDGVFVYAPAEVGSVTLGQTVTVTGDVAEYYGLTQVKAEAGGVRQAAEAGAPVTARELAFPLTEAEKEAHEGELLAPAGAWTVTDNYDVNQYGSLGLAPGTSPLPNPTSVALPGADAQAVAADNAQRLIVLDDGASTNFFRSPGNQNALPYIDADAPARVGSAVDFRTPVILDYRYGAWSFQPLGHLTDANKAEVQPVDIADTRPAEAVREDLGGNVTVGSFNVLNYFTTLGEDVPGCGYYADKDGAPVSTKGCLPRGAYTEEAFLEQQAKIATAINGMDTSVVALEEIENSEKFGLDRDHALAHLVDALNAQAGYAKWAYVASPTVRPALADEDVIRSAFIYQPAEVTPVGESVILDDQVNFANAREPMAQAFRVADGSAGGVVGTEFVAITNHFKSKGGSGATGDNVDTGDGQGAYNGDRTRMAQALVAFAEQMKVQAGTDRVLLMGDFNSYEKEDPIRVLEAAGYISQGAKTGEYSYTFDGAVGSLDGIYASPAADATVTGQDIWMINANESVAFEYSRDNYVGEEFYAPDQWRSSDHNPVLVGLQLDAPAAPVVPTPGTRPTPPADQCALITSPRGAKASAGFSASEWMRCAGVHPGKGRGRG